MIFTAAKKKIKNSNLLQKTFVAIFVLLVGILNFIFRNSDAIFFPILYAEDGVWIGKIISEGFWRAALNARPEFPVLGLVSLQNIALIINDIVNYGNLLKLPIVIAIVSAIFLSLPATLLTLINEEVLEKNTKIYLILAIWTVPIGSDGGEVFGRILNLGFYFPIYQLVTYLLYISYKNKLSEILLVIVNFIAILTFPVCLVVTISIGLLAFKKRRYDDCNRRLYFLCLIPVLAAIYFLINIKINSGGAGNNLALKNLPELIFGRMGVYPLVFGFYKYLNNFSAIAICAIVACFAKFSIINCENQKIEIKNTIVGVFLSYFMITLIFRYGLSNFLDGYSSTFPDRYYYGLNLAFIFVIAIMADRIFNGKIIGVLVLVMIINVVFDYKNIYEFSYPQQSWHDKGSLTEAICNANIKNINLEAPSIKISIYPTWENDVWKMEIPTDKYLVNLTNFCK